MTVIGNFVLSFQMIWSCFFRWSNVNSLSIIQYACIHNLFAFLVVFVVALLLTSFFVILIAFQWMSFFLTTMYSRWKSIVFLESPWNHSLYFAIVHFLVDSLFILCVDKWTRAKEINVSPLLMFNYSQRSIVVEITANIIDWEKRFEVWGAITSSRVLWHWRIDWIANNRLLYLDLFVLSTKKRTINRDEGLDKCFPKTIGWEKVVKRIIVDWR